MDLSVDMEFVIMWGRHQGNGWYRVTPNSERMHLACFNTGAKFGTCGYDMGDYHFHLQDPQGAIGSVDMMGES